MGNIIKLLFVLLLTCSICYAKVPTYEEEVYNEIKRRHELEMVEKQTEVLARLQMLGASQTNVNVYNSSIQNNNRKERKHHE